MEDSLLAVIWAAGAAGRLWLGPGLSGDPTPRLGLQASQAWFQEEPVGAEVYATRDLAEGRLRPVVGASVTDDGATWVGAGLKWTLGGDRAWVESALMPGLYARGDGPDLGSPIEFRSSLSLVYAFESGATVALSVDHRSNGDFASVNPGLETIGLRWAWPLD